MNVFITKKEYRLLLDMLYLSDWMMNAHAADDQEQHKEHQALRRKLLAYYKEMEAQDLIEYSEELDEYCELAPYEESLHDHYIGPYNTETFWEELLERLAERDVVKAVGVEAYQSMSDLECASKLEEIREVYADEFEQHGIDRIKIDYDTKMN